jgi:TolB-like protein/DNA-binding winged helix-turn-helix (wHTH) protein/Flp pilus assembly protein TadD
MKARDNLTLRIGAWRIDPALDQISMDGNTVKLEPRAMQLLLRLAEHAGEVVSVEQLLDEVWTGVVVTPDSVYHAVAALRRMLGDDTKQPTYIANVPRRGYRLVAPVAPWADAPDALEERSPDPAVESVIGRKAAAAKGWSLRWPVMALFIALGVGLGYVFVDKFWLSKSVAAAYDRTATVASVIGDKSIAVLPFVDLSEKSDQEYFADGMAEEVIALLAKIPGLTVIGHASSFQFKGTNKDLHTIATKLHVTYLVQGSVRRTNDRVHVTAHLIDTRDGATRWSQTYDRPASDALRVQDEIAVGLTRALEVIVDNDRPQSRRHPDSDEAYDLYLRGAYAKLRNDIDGLETAAIFLQHALDIDPTFAEAAEVLAGTYYAQANMSIVPARAGFQRARRAAEFALKLDPRRANAHAILGAIYTEYDRDWNAANREFKQALNLAPHDGTVLWRVAQLPVALGQYETARRLYKESLLYDPLFAPDYIMLAAIEQRSGHLQEAETAARRLLEIAPTYDCGHLYLGYTLLLEGDREAALAEMMREGNPLGQAQGLALVYHALGREDESKAALRTLVTEGANTYAAEIAEVYAYRGDLENALQWLNRASDQMDPILFMLVKADPWLKNLEGDPRFKAFLWKINLPE